MLITFFIPVAVSHYLLDRPSKVPFDEKPLKYMRKYRPKVIFVGNSMLGSRIDERLLFKISKRKAGVLRADGSASARFYSIMKNYVAASHARPRWVVVFFRDDELTRPRHRTDGRYRALLEKTMRDDKSDREILDILQKRDDQFGFFRAALESISPAFIGNTNHQHQIERNFNRLIFPKSRLSDPKKALKKVAMKHRFRKDITVPSMDAPDLNRSFAESVDESFLPLMLRLAHKENFKILFFQVKRRADFKERDPRLMKYATDLKSYVESQNGVVISEVADPTITEEMYGDGDHLSPLARDSYTRTFWERIGPMLE